MGKDRPLIIFGTSGAAKEIYYLVKQYNSLCKEQKYSILGFVAETEAEVGNEICDGVAAVISDTTIKTLLHRYDIIYGIIQFGEPSLKMMIVEKMKKYQNLKYPNIIHPSVIYDECALQIEGVGNIISAGSIIACNAKLGSFNLINRSCTIGHDFQLGDGNTINPGSVISGGVTIEDKCLIGAGSVILEKLSICSNTIIGAGGVLTKNIEIPGTYVGIPAKKHFKV